MAEIWDVEKLVGLRQKDVYASSTSYQIHVIPYAMIAKMKALAGVFSLTSLCSGGKKKSSPNLSA